MSNRVGANIAAFMTVFLWASAFPLTKVIGDQISANPLSLLRCFFAAILLIVIGLISKNPSLHLRKPFEKKDIIYFIFTGITGLGFYYICFNMGLVTLTSAEASVVSATTPVFTSILFFIVYKEKINLIGWISILSAFAGVAILMLWNGVFHIKVGVFWVLALSVSFSIYSALSKKLIDKGYNSLEIAAYSAIFAVILMSFLVPQSIRELSNCDVPAILSMIYLGIFPTGFALILWAKALELTVNTSEVSNYMFITPLLTTIMALIMIHEVPDISTYVGGLIIIAGVVVFSLKGSPQNEIKQ